MNRKIGIRFCGGCNPRIDRVAVAENVRNKLEILGYSLSEHDQDADFLIYLNGCSAACAERISGDYLKEVWVAGTMIEQMEKVSEEEIVQEILLRVRDYFEGLAE